MDCILTPNCIWRIVHNARSMGVTSANTSWCRLDIADQTVDEAAETRKEQEKVVAVLCSGSRPLDKLWNYFGAATPFASTRVLAQVRQIVRPVLRQRGGPFDARLRPAPVRRVIDGEKSGVSLRGRLLTRACRRYRSGCGCPGIWFGTGRGTSGLPKGHSSAVRSQRPRVAAASYVLMRNSIKAWSGSSAVRTAS